jgi:hypothetical protein
MLDDAVKDRQASGHASEEVKVLDVAQILERSMDKPVPGPSPGAPPT